MCRLCTFASHRVVDRLWRCVLGVALGICATLTLSSYLYAAAPVVLADGEFLDGTWSTDAVVLLGGAPVGSVEPSPLGGNPTSFLRSEITLQQGEGMRLEHFWRPSRYEPQSLGGIERIDYQIDSAFYSSGTFGQHLLLRQGSETYYFTMPDVNADWRTDRVLSLTAVNFFSQTDRDARPDFSPRGLPIEFGFSRQQFIASGASFTGVHGADNWEVTIHRGDRRQLVPAGSSWQYLDDGSNQGLPADGVSWYGHDNFDDTEWKSGMGPFGYGDDDETTIIDFGPDPEEKHITTYFRHSFNIDDTSLFRELTLNLQRDDAAAVYLNGRLVLLDNLSADYDFRTPAFTAEGDTSEYRYFLHALPMDYLRNGTNVLAVEIHQESVMTGDLSFDLELSATLVPEPNLSAAFVGVAWLAWLRRR